MLYVNIQFSVAAQTVCLFQLESRENIFIPLMSDAPACIHWIPKVTPVYRSTDSLVRKSGPIWIQTAKKHADCFRKPFASLATNWSSECRKQRVKVKYFLPVPSQSRPILETKQYKTNFIKLRSPFFSFSIGNCHLCKFESPFLECCSFSLLMIFEIFSFRNRQHWNTEIVNCNNHTEVACVRNDHRNHSAN